MLVTDIKCGGLYDFVDGKLTKVLRSFDKGNIKTFHRFPYAYYKKNYRKANKLDIRKYRGSYYNDEGIKVLYGYNRRN